MVFDKVVNGELEGERKEVRKKITKKRKERNEKRKRKNGNLSTASRKGKTKGCPIGRGVLEVEFNGRDQLFKKETIKNKKKKY